MGGYTPLHQPAPLPLRSKGPVGKQIHEIYKSRLRQFTDGGQYAAQSLRAKIYKTKISPGDNLKLSAYSPPDLTRPSFRDAVANEFKPIQLGASFGPSWSTHWIRVEMRIPKDMIKEELLEFHWDAGNEGLIWTEDGEPIQGLTGNGERIDWIVPHHFRDMQWHTFYIEMACNGMFGNAVGDMIQPPDPNRYFSVWVADIAAINVDARALSLDFWVLGDAARELSDDSWQEHQALQVANKIMDVFERANGSQESIRECRLLAQTFLGKVDSSEVYQPVADSALVYAIGHCHIDTCWLWPWAETKRKIARSWANQCDLMDRYPEHRFTCSQAQQYKWLEELYPKLFERVKVKVKEGKFQPVGGSWVEHDTNMPSGESLLRQFLYGQRYFESRFGSRCRTFWLPDTFGYSSQLPQVTRLAGMSRFFTQKISWNNINEFPHTTFRWVGLDNSQVLCHMAPANTYTADANFGDVKRSLTQNKSMDQDPRGLLVFGKGDGGGGPTWEHLEKLRRCAGLAQKSGGRPQSHLGGSVEDFYDKLEQKAEDGTKFVTWYGELYLELHRGTYTTQAKNKLNNRRAEAKLHDLEYIATMVSVSRPAYRYPKKELDQMWEGLLLCQFHDCLPGSALEMCYRDSDKVYADIFRTADALLEKALAAIGLSCGPVSAQNEVIVGLNTLPWPRNETIFQSELSKEPISLVTPREPASGLMRLSAASPDTPDKSRPLRIEEIGENEYRLSNRRLTVVVKDGSITSMYDMAEHREILAPNERANQYVLFDDKPLYWQAWDVEIYHLDTRRELKASSSKIVEESEHIVCLETHTIISEHSWIKTRISLASTTHDNTADMVSFDCEIEWQEDMKFLKVEFPVDILNTEASYETQFGIIRRPTHYNTSWDTAKFEVCCHRFADLSEAGYGVSILNDCKYGFAVAGHMMRLSLLRAPKAPDAHADMGRHKLRYAIMPHSGPLDHRTVRAARSFNQPISIHRCAPKLLSSIDKLLSSIRLEGCPALILDTIKRGEDDEDISTSTLPRRTGKSVILRIYESLGGRARGFVCLDGDLKVQKIFATNALEDDEREVERQEHPHGFKVDLRPFEVATYRVQL